MKFLIVSLIKLYSTLLHLYPVRFRDEFAKEMQAMFRDTVSEAIKDGILQLLLVGLRELGGLPFNILREFWYESQRKITTMALDQNVSSKPELGTRARHGDAIIAALPYMIFGITSMIDKLRIPIHGGYLFLAFSAFALLGLMIGLAKGFPRPAYSYLGWSVAMSWWWTAIPIDTFRNSNSPITHNQLLGWWGLAPLLIAIGIGSILAQSFLPLRRLITGIWQDWTLLSLGLYTSGGFVFLIFDENHHPYLFVFMIATTLVIAGSVWAYMNSIDTKKRVAALLSGFVASYIISRICDATWDWAGYYGFPPSPPNPWYTEITSMIFMTIFWSVIMFWPALIGLVRYLFDNRQKPRMAA